MTKKNEIYKCPLCGNIVEVMHTGAGELVCCGQPMDLMAENTVDAALEKHVPVVTKENDGIKVVVGSVAHPMEDKHWIEWIELDADGKVYRQNPCPMTGAILTSGAGRKPLRLFAGSGSTIAEGI
ncbi:MAG: desulfoferrodoxin [Deltaproteobacteria bacterium]|nr:desulfoferrodoxin [Deltaproteobacteria bacterium]